MSIVNEIWKDVVGFEGYYQVSNLGRVRSLDRLIVHRDGHRRFYDGQLLVLVVGNCGYYRARLNKNSAKAMPLVHKLVALAFIGDRPKGCQINHIDGRKSNNCVENLEYCSGLDNIRHAYASGLFNNAIGENSHHAKLKDSDIPVIRDRILQGHTHKAISKDYGVSTTTISRAASGYCWSRNQANPVPKGFYFPRVGSATSKAKLTEADIPVIRQRLALGDAQAAIARGYGVDPKTIRCIKTGQTWGHVK